MYVMHMFTTSVDYSTTLQNNINKSGTRKHGALLFNKVCIHILPAWRMHIKPFIFS